MMNIQVKELWMIPFSIGKHKDEIVCDVVEIYMCHILLERP